MSTVLPCRATARGDQDDPHHEDPVEGGEHDLCLFGTLGSKYLLRRYLEPPNLEKVLGSPLGEQRPAWALFLVTEGRCM